MTSSELYRLIQYLKSKGWQENEIVKLIEYITRQLDDVNKNKAERVKNSQPPERLTRIGAHLSALIQPFNYYITTKN